MGSCICTEPDARYVTVLTQHIQMVSEAVCHINVAFRACRTTTHPHTITVACISRFDAVQHVLGVCQAFQLNGMAL